MSKDNIDRIDDILDWYSVTSECISQVIMATHNSKIYEISPNSIIPQEMLYMSLNEISQYININERHLSESTCLKLISAFEGGIKYDAEKRTRKKRIGKIFRSLYRRVKSKGKKGAGLITIIDTWLDYHGIPYNQIGNVKGIIKYRHWLAHGKYWDKKQLSVAKSAITPEIIYGELRKCLDIFKKYEPDFEW
jgi:hypothetical protein